MALMASLDEFVEKGQLECLNEDKALGQARASLSVKRESKGSQNERPTRCSTCWTRALTRLSVRMRTWITSCCSRLQNGRLWRMLWLGFAWKLPSCDASLGSSCP